MTLQHGMISTTLGNGHETASTRRVGTNPIRLKCWYTQPSTTSIAPDRAARGCVNERARSTARRLEQNWARATPVTLCIAIERSHERSPGARAKFIIDSGNILRSGI